MQVNWNAHRFSGGALALDIANTVVLRGDPEQTFDRFERPEEIVRFAEAASRFRAEELCGRRVVADVDTRHATIVALREAVDRCFRGSALSGSVPLDAYGAMLSRCAAALKSVAGGIGRERPFGDPSTPIRLETAVAISALSLDELAGRGRIRICRNCRWLFLDRSRNSSRLWCDMTVCGNRSKARRHYQRHREKVSRDPH
ncbi:MAG: CGNR zinc finger domain-containing protein [Rhizobiaceae bacterium]